MEFCSFYLSLQPQIFNKLSQTRRYTAILMLLMFCCYYSGISMFAHTHIVNGSSVVHSHLGGSASHEHSSSQYVVIDMLSNLQSEGAVEFHIAGAPFIYLSESFSAFVLTSYQCEGVAVVSLRGPPQA